MSSAIEAVDRELGQLLVRIAGGDRGAFGRLYDLSSGRLFAVAKTVLRKPELAEEALQDAFVKIWQRARQYDPNQAKPLAWLAAIVRNQAIDVRRRFAERIAATAQEPDEADTPVLAEAELAFELKRLRDCLARLPEDRQDMVLLAYYQGWSREELSAQFQRPVTTIKTLLRRSLASLKECLDGRI